jgi:nucleoside-diphosphate-sugar epimerase
LIIGNGLLATSLSRIRHENSVLFASGVSDSKQVNEIEFERERELLVMNLKNTTTSEFFYFSTCSIFDPSLTHSRYISHKRRMEDVVLSKPCGRVIRLPNLVGPMGNPANLINYLTNSIKRGYPIEIQRHATRYLLGVDEMNTLFQAVVDHGTQQLITSLTPPKNIKVTSIVSVIESILGVKALSKMTESGTPYEVDFSDTRFYASRLGFEFGDNYYESILEKRCKLAE